MSYLDYSVTVSVMNSVITWSIGDNANHCREFEHSDVAFSPEIKWFSISPRWLSFAFSVRLGLEYPKVSAIAAISVNANYDESQGRTWAVLYVEAV